MLYARRGFPFTGKQVCVLAFEMASRDNNKGFSPVKKQAGRAWLRGFYKRNPEIRQKVSVNLSIARAIAANPTQIGKFFEEYTQWLEDWGIEYAPNRIWNVDECSIGDIPQMTSVVGVTGERAFQTVSGEKPQNTTIVSYVSAGGLAVPPMVIFKAAKIKPEWREAAPSGYMVRASQSRYINGRLFQEYGEHFIKYLIEKKILVRDAKVMVLLDMHKAHLFNLGFMEYMKARNVEVCCFPPHCIHILQPLNDTPFALFKCEYQRQLLWVNWILCGYRMSRVQFLKILVPAYTTAMMPEAIRSGFRNTGIYPPNQLADKLKQTTASAVYDRCKLIDRSIITCSVRSRSMLHVRCCSGSSSLDDKRVKLKRVTNVSYFLQSHKRQLHLPMHKKTRTRMWNQPSMLPRR